MCDFSRQDVYAQNYAHHSLANGASVARVQRGQVIRFIVIPKRWPRELSVDQQEMHTEGRHRSVAILSDISANVLI